MNDRPSGPRATASSPSARGSTRASSSGRANDPAPITPPSEHQPEHQPAFLSQVPGGIDLRVKVVPGASRDRLAGLLGDRLKIRVAAPPEAGKANHAVCALIARWLGTKDVTLVAGPTNPEKTIRVAGRRALTRDELTTAGC